MVGKTQEAEGCLAYPNEWNVIIKAYRFDVECYSLEALLHLPMDLVEGPSFDGLHLD